MLAKNHAMKVTTKTNMSPLRLCFRKHDVRILKRDRV